MMYLDLKSCWTTLGGDGKSRLNLDDKDVIKKYFELKYGLNSNSLQSKENNKIQESLSKVVINWVMET